jgi:hypothetical protein
MGKRKKKTDGEEKKVGWDFIAALSPSTESEGMAPSTGLRPMPRTACPARSPALRCTATALQCNECRYYGQLLFSVYLYTILLAPKVLGLMNRAESKYSGPESRD